MVSTFFQTLSFKNRAQCVKHQKKKHLGVTSTMEEICHIRPHILTGCQTPNNETSWCSGPSFPHLPTCNYGSTPVTPRHFQPGDILQDRADLYSEAGSEIDSDEDDLHLSGSAVYNSRRDPAPGVNLPSINQLVQQQQGMLLKIIQQQETLQENQTQYAERLDAIESTLSKMSQCRSAEQNSKQQERSRLPKGLGVSCHAYGTHFPPSI